MCENPLIKTKFYDTEKIIRDIVHGYINLSKYEIFLIDTPHFQRLKDIRQLTCQHVFPNANHSRFEHSLGVLELMHMAISALKHNSFLEEEKTTHFTDELIISAFSAAILHDVGHSPFSHLGEAQMDLEDTQLELAILLCKYRTLFAENFIKKAVAHKSVHEIMSCIVILSKYKDSIDSFCDGLLEVDYEFMLRSILGIKYMNDTDIDLPDKLSENILISLISSDSLDMDKLDYIMRDSINTGVSLPTIDVRRLFRNMYISKENGIIFNNKALPVLQNVVEARDNLYRYVYNHHTAIYTDFLYYYTLRRLNRNYQQIRELESNQSSPKFIHRPGMLNKSAFLSVNGIVKSLYSDSDLRYVLRNGGQYDEAKIQYSRKTEINNAISQPEEKQVELTKLYEILKAKKQSEIDAEIEKKLKTGVMLSRRLFERQYLKPIWKTLDEYNSFLVKNFNNRTVQTKLPEIICSSPYSEEYRSQIVKAVRSVFNKDAGKPFVLEDGDFFLIPRENKFYTPASLENFFVYFPYENTKYLEEGATQYYNQSLGQLIKSKKDANTYDKFSFYLFVNHTKILSSNENYNLFIDTFVEKASYFAKLSGVEFENQYIEVKRQRKMSVLDLWPF